MNASTVDMWKGRNCSGQHNGNFRGVEKCYLCVTHNVTVMTGVQLGFYFVVG